MPLLLQVCPSFTEKWEEHRAYYGDDEELLYVDLGEFARHLIELRRAEKTEEFSAVFDVIETLHLDGDDYVRNAATVGMLEAIQNNASDEAEEFTQYLKPESAKWWRKLNAFWAGDVGALN
jgi:hypothetical protein